MPNYYQVKEGLCVATGALKVIPKNRNDIFEAFEGSPKLGQRLVNSVWVDDVNAVKTLTRDEFILKMGRDAYIQLKQASANDPIAAWALMLERQTKDKKTFESNDKIVNEFLQSIVDVKEVTAFTKVEKDAFFS